MTWFEGWANAADPDKARKEQELKYSKTNYRTISSFSKHCSEVGFQGVMFEGNLTFGSKLTDEQLLAYATEGNNKFGGFCTRIGSHFYGQFVRTEEVKFNDA